MLDPNDADVVATTWRNLREEAVRRLRASGVGTPEAEARWLVEQAAPDVDGPVTERAIGWFDAMLGRREAGEPLQYVLGAWGFRQLDLMVDRRVLIPRPETEIVAGAAIEELRRLAGRRAVDLGTGSGAIALSIAAEVLTTEVWAVERSAGALDVARANLAGLGRPAHRVTLLEGDWFEPLPDDLRGEIDVIVSNPPYVATGDELPAVVREWEPSEALLAGDDGLDDLRHIVAAAPEWLRRPGTLVVECAPAQSEEVAGFARAAGFGDVSIGRDLAGRDRFVQCRVGSA